MGFNSAFKGLILATALLPLVVLWCVRCFVFT